MFGNKAYGWKLAAGLAVIAALGVSAGLRGELLNPSVWRCLADPASMDGSSLWVPSARIIAVRDGDYEVRVGDAQIRVTGRAPGPAESRIALTAVFRAEGPRLEPLQTRPLPEGELSRRLMEAVSVLVTLGVLVNFGRHFGFRPKALQAGREGT